MANPQRENGYTAIANEILEALARIDIPGEARRVLDVIMRKTYGFNKKEDVISYSQLAYFTGLSRRNAIRAVQSLVLMNLISVKKDTTNSYSINKDFETWKPVSKKTLGVVSKSTLSSVKTDQKLVSRLTHTKETITKESITKEIIKQPQAANAVFKDVKEVLDSVYNQGFNIYQLINKFKKDAGWDKEQSIPDEVLLKLCHQYQKDKARISQPYPWFIRVLKAESSAYFAKRSIEESNQFKSRGAQRLGDILNQIQHHAYR